MTTDTERDYGGPSGDDEVCSRSRMHGTTKRFWGRARPFWLAVAITIAGQTCPTARAQGSWISLRDCDTYASAVAGMQPPLPKGRYFRKENDAAEKRGSLDLAAERLAAQLRSYSLSQVGIVTRATRRDFWVNLGTSDGIYSGLRAEVLRLNAESALSPDDITKALADPEFLERPLLGQTAPVTRARVVKVYADSALLRSADPHRGRRVKTGDLVKVLETRMRLCVGGISGTLPGTVIDALRNLLIDELKEGGAISAIRGPSEPIGIGWSQGKAAALCTAAVDHGCDYATAGAAHLSGDTLHVALGLVDVSSCETVRFITASIEADLALKAIVSQSAADGEQLGEPRRPHGVELLGVFDKYETGLRPAFAVELPRRALAVFVLSETRSLCVADQKSLELYHIASEGRSLVGAGAYAIEHSSPPRPCRDPAGRIVMADSDGDGRDELVFWSGAFQSPVAFSIIGGQSDEKPGIEPADTYWLPWSGPYGDTRYVPGANFMTSGDGAGSVDFYDSRYVDLDGDGRPESIYTETGGALRVDDVSRHLSLKPVDAGAPLEVYDMNLDGLAEIIISDPTLPGRSDALTFYNYMDDGAHESWRLEDLPGGIISMAAGLLDGDHLPDLVVLLRESVRAETTTLIIMLTAPGSSASPGRNTERR